MKGGDTLTTQERKLHDWLEKNPDGYYSLPMKDIAEQSGTTVASASRLLPRLIARRDNTMPSEVKQKRFTNTVSRIDREKLWSLHNEGKPVEDIAFLLDCNEGSVRDILRNEKPFEQSSNVQAAHSQQSSSDKVDGD